MRQYTRAGLYYEQVKSFEIKRRTFEGRTNPGKNNNSLTSKYMPSYKYWVRIVFENYTTDQCFPTKKQCVDYVEQRKRAAGKPL